MKTLLFDYHLPPEKIAQHPLEERDGSRLLVVKDQVQEEAQGRDFDEIVFRDITTLLHPWDILVINDTKVMPARIKWTTFLQENRKQKTENTKEVECLFLRNTAPDIWEIMCFPGERLKTWRQIILENGMTLEIVGETYAGRLVRVPVPHYEWLEVLHKYGEIPLPPYITEHLENSDLYQTVYAKNLGSTASPTAGRHFTPELLTKIQNMGVKIAHVTLHIWPGTFKPIYEEDVTEYQIHSEFVTIPAETIQILQNKGKGRVIAVGTTSMRSLESYAAGKFQEQTYGVSGDTNLYITPGYEFQLVDVLITNFHAPRTSLLVLVAAFMGLENMQKVYWYALENDFRFLSFGDAMWVGKK